MLSAGPSSARATGSWSPNAVRGSFTRQLQLGDAVDAQNVQASYTNGVLCLTIPAAPQSQPRRIEVQQGQGQQQIEVSGEQDAASSNTEQADATD